MKGPIVAAVHSPGIVAVGLRIAAIVSAVLGVIAVVAGIVGLAKIVGARPHLFLGAIACPPARIVAVFLGVIGLAVVVSAAAGSPATVVFTFLPVFPGHGVPPSIFEPATRKTGAVPIGSLIVGKPGHLGGLSGPTDSPEIHLP